MPHTREQSGSLVPPDPETPSTYTERGGEREREREGGREGEGEREREGGREGEREREREGEREGG